MILVTGARGYIGNAFIEKYQHIYRIKSFSLMRGGLEDLDLSGIDTVLHLAALVHQKKELPYKEYEQINIHYPIELAKKAKGNGVKQFIFMSTIAVYGNHCSNLSEDTICNPLTNYGKSKLKSENALLALQDENFIISIIRPPMVYGMDAPGNIKSLVSLIKKLPVLPFAKIDNKRSFVFIGNLIALIDTIIKRKASGIFLAGDDKAISTTYLSKMISTQLNQKKYFIKLPLFIVFLKMFKPSLYNKLYDSLEVDNSHTKKVLGFKNPYTSEEGIKYMIKGEKV